MSQLLITLPNKSKVEGHVSALTDSIHALLLISDAMGRTIVGNALSLVSSTLEKSIDALREELGMPSSVD